MFLCLFLCVQSAFCAMDVEEKVPFPLEGMSSLSKKEVLSDADVFDPPPPYAPVDARTMLLQFKSPKEGLCQVALNTYGVLYNSSCSFETVFDMQFALGDEKGVLVCSETTLDLLITQRVALFIKQNKGIYSCGGVTPLSLNCLAEAFPQGKSRQWRVLPLEAAGESLFEGEVRIVCDKGVFSSLGFVEKALSVEMQPGLLPPGTKRWFQVKEEKTEAFVERMRTLAYNQRRALEQNAIAQDGEVIIRYVEPSGRERAVAWDSWGVLDGNNRTLMNFLISCSLQGTFLGCSEEKLRYYAFVNDDIAKALCTSLALDILKNERVSSVKGRDRVKTEDLWSLPQMAWTVVPGAPLSLHCLGACSITFAGITLEGVPRWERWSGVGTVLPRCLLWGDDHKALLQKKERGVDWYDGFVPSDKVTWKSKKISALRMACARVQAFFA